MKIQLLISFLFIINSNASILTELPQCEGKGDFLDGAEDFTWVEQMSWMEMILGIIICAFTAVCFIPQIYKLIKTKDATGLSPSFLVIFALNQITATINATVTNFPTMHSCIYVGWGVCLPQLMSYFQIVEGLFLCYPIFALFIIFFKDKTTKEFKRTLIYFVSSVLLLIISAVACLLLIFYAGECNDFTYYYGFAFAVGCTLTTLVEYLPQIVRTLKTKECGSMSFTTNWTSTLGTGIVALYMMFSTKQHWTTVISYITAFIEHFVLCVIQVKYDYFDKCNKRFMKNNMKKFANVFRKCFKMELYDLDDDYSEMRSIDYDTLTSAGYEDFEDDDSLLPSDSIQPMKIDDNNTNENYQDEMIENENKSPNVGVKYMLN